MIFCVFLVEHSNTPLIYFLKNKTEEELLQGKSNLDLTLANISTRKKNKKYIHPQYFQKKKKKMVGGVQVLVKQNTGYCQNYLLFRFQKQAERIRRSGKFSGYGLFEMDMNTLTVMAELLLTYVIVLVTSPW